MVVLHCLPVRLECHKPAQTCHCVLYLSHPSSVMSVCGPQPIRVGGSSYSLYEAHEDTCRMLYLQELKVVVFFPLIFADL